jgi:hypothetical protein
MHHGPIGTTRARISECRGTNIGKLAAARKLLKLVYRGLRDGRFRCVARLIDPPWLMARGRHDDGQRDR